MSVLRLEVSSITHNFMLDKMTCSQSLTIKAFNVAGDALLLGEDYQYVNPSCIELHSNSRKNIDLQITLVERTNKESFPKGCSDQLYLGEMQFWKELDFGVKGATRPPTLCALVFLQNEFFFDICQHMDGESYISKLEVSISDLEWDWDPAGNRVIWESNVDGQFLNKPISAINLSFTHDSSKKSFPILSNQSAEQGAPSSDKDFKVTKMHFSLIVVISVALIAIIVLDSIFR